MHRHPACDSALPIHHNPLVRLDQRDQLAEDLGDVGTVNLVDEQRIAFGRIGAGFIADLFEDAVHHAKLGRAVVARDDGSDATDKVLVGERRMERYGPVAPHRLAFTGWTRLQRSEQFSRLRVLLAPIVEQFPLR